MKRFVCHDVIPGCAEVITGPSDQSVLDQVISHVAADHGLVKPPLALIELVVATTQTMPAGRNRGHLRLVDSSGDGTGTAPVRALPRLTDQSAPSAPSMAGRAASTVELLAAGAMAAHQEYRHECLLYRGIDAFTAAVVPFVRDGLALGQPVMVAVAEPRLQTLRESLGDDAHRVVFADMAVLGRNPARIIPAWREFTLRTAGQPVRGVGEPIWAGRGAAEIVECQLHEALLNLAVHSAIPLWLICPYDVEALDDSIVAEALRSHPTVTESNNSAASRFYAGTQHGTTAFAELLPEPIAAVTTNTFDHRRNAMAAGRILQYAKAAGMPAQRSAKMAAAADEVAQAALGTSGGAQIRLWQQDGSVVCEVGDHGEIADPLVGRSPNFGPNPRERAIRLANELCDLVQVRSNRFGTAVRMHTLI